MRALQWRAIVHHSGIHPRTDLRVLTDHALHGPDEARPVNVAYKRRTYIGV